MKLMVKNSLKKIIVLILLFAFQVNATTYYVNTASTGSGDGTTTATTGANAAWAAISEITGLSAGDYVLFNKGDTWREQLTVPSSGSAGSPITFDAYGTGADPIIDAADLVTTWSQYLATNIYSASVGWTTKDVIEDIGNDKRLTVVTWDTDIATTAATMSAGTWSLDDDNNLLYVWATDSTDPDTHIMNVGRRSHPIKIWKMSYITVDGLDLRHGRYSGVNITDFQGSGGTTNITIQNCTISYVYERGLWIIPYTSTGPITIRNNDISYSGGDGIHCLNVVDGLITGNTIHNNSQLEIETTLPSDPHNSTSGIRFYGTSTSNIITEYNTVYQQGKDSSGSDVIAGTGLGEGIWYDETGKTNVNRIVRYNTVYDNYNIGIHIENETWYAEVYYNVVYDNAQGITVFDEISHCEVFNNVCYNNTTSGLKLNGSGQAVNYNTFKNNISVGNGTELRAIYGGNNGAEAGGGTGNVYLNNCFGAESANFIQVDSEVNKSTYDAWETAYGSSTHSAESDPLFVDAANDDFHLKAMSPCVNTGVDVGLTRDFVGAKIKALPDMGAYETGIGAGGIRSRYSNGYRVYRTRYR